MEVKIKLTIIILLVVAGVGWAILPRVDQPAVDNPEPSQELNFEAIKLENGVYREITAYNVGDEAQTDDTPCIGAYGNIDLCKVLESGRRVCASNAYPKYSIIYIEGYGECEVLDRMSAKYGERVDIAFPLDQKLEARLHGLKFRKVYLIK